MNLSIPVTNEIEARLRERSAAVGKDPAEYVAEVLTRDLAKPSIDELLDPVRRDFIDCGMDEAQIMELGRAELTALRQGARP